MLTRDRASVRDLAALETFVKVVEQGSFVASAVEMYSSPSWISKKIARLESEVGKRLLNRTTHELSLTECGKIFYQHAVRILYDVDRAIDSVHETGDDVSGTLRVQITPGTGQRIILPLIFAFMREHPQLSIEAAISSGSADVVQRGLDLAICSGDESDRHSNQATVEARQIGSAGYQILASPDYFARFGKPGSPRDLANHRCLIQASQPSAREWLFNDGSEAYSVRVNGTLIVDDWSVLYGAARAGLGIVRLQAMASTLVREEEGLESLFDESVAGGRGIWAFYPHARPLSRKLGLLLSYLEDQLKS
jgi:DNA-binding transcriptional LysR family regulator